MRSIRINEDAFVYPATLAPPARSTAVIRRQYSNKGWGKIKVIKKIHKMQTLSEQFRKKGKKIVFVPTMGALHEGHLKLLKRGRRMGDLLVMSLFVNPQQFNQREDFEKYPKNETEDLILAKEEGVDVVFIPGAEDMYPEGYDTYVEVQELGQNLCGAFRPGHFKGVATVVMKLFNIVKPHVAVFGEKDYQQLVIIRRMVRDLNMDVKVIPAPIVREKDGIAMSSRNIRLGIEDRQTALLISKSLKRAKKLFDEKERRSNMLISEVKSILSSDTRLRTEYVQIVDNDSLKDVSLITGSAVLAVAAWVGEVRLIDNIKLYI